MLNIIAVMSTESAVLCALLRLARRRGPVTMNDLLARVAARPRDIRRAVAALVRADLVLLTPNGPKLSLAGLAVAAASAAVRAEKHAPLARVAPPLVRRRRAA